MVCLFLYLASWQLYCRKRIRIFQGALILTWLSIDGINYVLGGFNHIHSCAVQIPFIIFAVSNLYFSFLKVYKNLVRNVVFFILLCLNSLICLSCFNFCLYIRILFFLILFYSISSLYCTNSPSPFPLCVTYLVINGFWFSFGFWLFVVNNFTSL